jgi:hypothetical protein
MPTIPNPRNDTHFSTTALCGLHSRTAAALTVKEESMSRCNSPEALKLEGGVQ